MADPIYKIVEVVGTSEQSIPKAIDNAINKASGTLRNLGWFKVAQMRGAIKDGKVQRYQVTLKGSHWSSSPGMFVVSGSDAAATRSAPSPIFCMITSVDELKSGKVTIPPSRTLAVATCDGIVVPRVIADAGDQAARRFLEFFAATIRNKNTRMAYYRAVCDFFSWCDRHRIGGIADIEPLHVAAYIENLQHAMSKPTVKQHLAAIRMLFDWLVTGQVVATNPAHSVRGPKHVVKTGKTTVLDAEQARALLDSIDTSTVVGLRDRALISVMTFAFARIGAVVAMRVEDYYPQGKRWWVRLHEKGGKRHEMPAHHTLEAYLDTYIEAAGIRDGSKTPLFRSAAGRTGMLTEKPMNRVDAWRMIQRRAAELGMRVKIGCHTFRATGITAYLEAGGTLENAQLMAAHESPRTTKLYDRTGDEITLDEVERISI